jgi:tetratricopeptide (TPR) repeat protein
MIQERDACATAAALIEKAENWARAGNYASSGELTERALDLARRCGDAQLLGRTLINVARLEQVAGRTPLAFEAAAESYRLFCRCRDVPGQTHALTMCAIAYHQCGDIVNSIELMRRGLLLAVGAEHAVTRCTILQNMGAELADSGEHTEALECLREAVEITLGLPDRTTERVFLSTRLALVHQQYASRLREQGHATQADQEQRAAARCLPPLPALSWRSLSRLQAYCFILQAEVRADFGQWSSARFAAAMAIRFARHRAGALVELGWALTAAATLHRRQKQWERAIRCENRVLATWRAASGHPEVASTLRRLSQLHALTGDHDHALALRKELAAQQSRSRPEANALRCRLAAIERQAERRHRQAQEATAHAQRLAVIGRLISQTHHALSAPITQARLLAGQALACADSPEALRPLMDQISQAIDHAAGLVSQLKLFSYRSSPQPMALSLHEALLDAWRGLETHTGSHGAELRVSGRTQLQVWGDAQRLGIMLKVLLIELMQQAGANGVPVVIGAHINAGQADVVLLHVEAGRCALPSRPAAAPSSLGAELCKEIAAEMRGDLHLANNGSAQLRYRLQLPDAERRRSAMGGNTAPTGPCQDSPLEPYHHRA